MEHDSGRREDPVASEQGHTEGAAADQERTAQEPADDGPGSAEVTGVAQVDEAIAGLDGLPGRPLAEHVAVFEEAHAKLRQVLSDLDDGPADS